jgi:anti-anti-sigma factor
MNLLDRNRDVGALNLVSTFLSSFPPSARVAQEEQLSGLERVREDGALSLLAEQDGDAIVIRAVGELDIASAKTLEAELGEAVSAASAIVLDLDGLSFIDSTGLRTLLRAAQLASRHGSALRIRRGSPQVERAIEVAHVEDLLPLTD